MCSLMNYTPEERVELQLPHLIALAEKVCVSTWDTKFACCLALPQVDMTVKLHA